MQGRRLAVAVAASLVVIGIAPFVARIREALGHILGESFALGLGLVFAAAVAAVVAWVARRIREDRLRRYALLALGLLLVASQLVGWSRAIASVNAVERFHFLFYGVLTFLYFRAFHSRRDLSTALLALLAVTIVAVADETVQRLVPVRTGEIFDIGLNAWAGLCALLICFAVDGLRGWSLRFPRVSAPAVLCLLAATIASLAFYVDLAHLGYLVEDPEIGTFRSYFRRERLVELSRRRAAEWAAAPPGELRPLEREDYFRTEAGWHVHRRNDALVAEDWPTAAHEDALLERYYGPFLDLVDSAGRRYALNPDERRRLEKGLAESPLAEADSWQSTVFRDPLRVWLRPTKPMLWGATGAVVLLLLVAAARLSGATAP